MANIMIIDYLYMDNLKKEEWIDIINSSKIDINWLNSKSRIEIRWDWEDQNKVEDLIQAIRNIFSEVTIKIKNSIQGEENIGLETPIEKSASPPSAESEIKS